VFGNREKTLGKNKKIHPWRQGENLGPKTRRFGRVLPLAHPGTIVWFIYAFIIELSFNTRFNLGFGLCFYHSTVFQ
jgi:hypothetical protein